MPPRSNNCSTLVRDIEEWRAFADARQRLKDWLSNVPPPTGIPTTIIQGIELLQRWLAAQHSAAAQADGQIGISRGRRASAALSRWRWPSSIRLGCCFSYRYRFAAWSFWPRSTVSPQPPLTSSQFSLNGLSGSQPLPAWTEDNVRRTLMWLQDEWRKAKLDKQVNSTLTTFGRN